MTQTDLALLSMMNSTLYRARVEAGLSQRALAAKAGVSNPTISFLERGLSTPRPKTAARIAAALQLPVFVLFPALGERHGPA